MKKNIVLTLLLFCAASLGRINLKLITMYTSLFKLLFAFTAKLYTGI